MNHTPPHSPTEYSIKLLLLPQPESRAGGRSVLLTVPVTASAGQVAGLLARELGVLGVARAEFLPGDGAAPGRLSLEVAPPTGSPWRLRPGEPLLGCGLRHGWSVRLCPATPGPHGGAVAGAGRTGAGDVARAALLPPHRVVPLAAGRDRGRKLGLQRTPQGTLAAGGGGQRGEIALPSPPQLPARSGGQLAAMLLPLVLGLAMFAATGQPLSLLFALLTPLVFGLQLAGVWGGARRRWLRELGSFEREFAASALAAASAFGAEAASARRECATLATILQGIGSGSRVLWAGTGTTRFTLGRASEQSGVQLATPVGSGAACPPLLSDALTALRERFTRHSSLPFSVQISGAQVFAVLHGVRDAAAARACARALLLQLCLQHSPGELSVRFYLPGDQHTNSERLREEWCWLGWLPHASRESRLGVALASEQCSDTRLRLTVVDAALLSKAEVTHATTALSASGDAVLLIAPGPAFLPADCKDYLQLLGMPLQGSVECGGKVALQSADGRARNISGVPLLGAKDADTLARQLAKYTTAAAAGGSDAGGGALPEQVPLARVLPELAAHTPAQLAAAWRQNDAELSLRTPVGALPGGAAMHIDLHAMGPHALVAGTTGAGKSEFLQSWLTGMAARLGPHRLQFLLIDYKGGAGFAECARLPHTAALITDLTPALAKRALVSLRAELHSREELLARHGATQLRKLHARGVAAPPLLLVAVDEFATLTRELPEFVRGVLDVAERGRSLGVHLILATQRPAGVVTDAIRANTNLRIALRVASAADSRDVLGSGIAAEFAPDIPGRAALSLGEGEPRVFQAAYSGAAAGGRGESRWQVRILNAGEVRSDAGTAETATGPLTKHKTAREKTPRGRNSGQGKATAHLSHGHTTPTQLQLAVRQLIAAAREPGITIPPSPLLPPLPQSIPLRLGCSTEAGRALDPARLSNGTSGDTSLQTIGTIDLPTKQRQLPLPLPAPGTVTALVGAGGCGKTAALLALAASFTHLWGRDNHRDKTGRQPRLYALDYAGGGLAQLQTLPNLRCYAGPAQEELTHRALAEVVQLARERAGSACSTAATPSTPTEHQTGEAPGGSALPRSHPPVLLLLDGLWAFRERFDTGATLGNSDEAREQATSAGHAHGDDDGAVLLELLRTPPWLLLQELLARARAADITVVMSAQRPLQFMRGVAEHVSCTLLFRLADAADCGALLQGGEAVREAVAVLAEAPPGRCLLLAGRGGAGWPADVAGSAEVQLHHLTRPISKLSISDAGQTQPSQAGRLRDTPTVVSQGSLPWLREGASIGLHVLTQRPVSMPPSGLVVVTDKHRGTGEAYLPALAHAHSIWRAAAGSPPHAEYCINLAVTEGSCSAGPLMRLARADLASGKHLLIVVEGLQQALGDTLQAAAGLLQEASSAGGTLLLTALTRGLQLPWELQAPLKQAAAVVMLSPRRHDTCPITHDTPPPLPFGRQAVGRGYLLTPHGSAPVQLVKPEPGSASRRSPQLSEKLLPG